MLPLLTGRCSEGLDAFRFFFKQQQLYMYMNPSRGTKFSGANADREILIFPVQLTTSRIGNLARLIHTLAICVTIHTYMGTFLCDNFSMFLAG